MFPSTNYPDLLVGLGAPDDSAVYQLNEEQAIISTTDFFPPVVDDPYHFGAIAAANALSDVYAMGGEPLMAINLVAYPDGLISPEILSEILRGGAEKVLEAGAVVAGGHTVTDKEPKYGLAVTGTVHPTKIMTKGGVRPGDVLFLTKPLGVGVVTTAIKQDIATDEEIAAAIASMSRLNRDAARSAVAIGAHAMTDITGYGLIGHALEMAQASHVTLEFDVAAFEWLPGASRLAQEDVFPGGMERNREFLASEVTFSSNIPEYLQYLLYDPETSGGLLIAVAEANAEEFSRRLSDIGASAKAVGTATTGEPHLRFA